MLRHATTRYLANAANGTVRSVVHSKSCRVERVEVCRRLFLAYSLVPTLCGFVFFIPIVDTRA